MQGTFKLQFNCSGFDFCGFFSQIKCDRLLHENIEGRTRGKPTKGRRRIQMLHDLADGDGCVALKWAAENREGWRHRERMSRTCCTAEDGGFCSVLL